MMATAPRLSLPREHGAYLTIAAAALAAAGLAPLRTLALLCAGAVSLAFVLRGPLDRLAAGLTPRQFDGTAVVVLSLLASGLLALGLSRAQAPSQRLGVLGASAAVLVLPLSSFVLRRHKLARRPWAESLALAAMGCVAGVELLAGGAGWRTALALGTLMAAHAATSVPMVRSAVRGTRPGIAAVLGPLAFGALLAGLVAGAPCALVLAPRGAHFLVRLRGPRTRPSLVRLGLAECALLAATVALATLTL